MPGQKSFCGLARGVEYALQALEPYHGGDPRTVWPSHYSLSSLYTHQHPESIGHFNPNNHQPGPRNNMKEPKSFPFSSLGKCIQWLPIDLYKQNEKSPRRDRALVLSARAKGGHAHGHVQLPNYSKPQWAPHAPPQTVHRPGRQRSPALSCTGWTS